MALVAINWSPSARQLRHFGCLLALLAAVAGLTFRPGLFALGLELAGAVLLSVGLIWPRSLYACYLLVVTVTLPIGWLLSHALLGLVYYGMITPLAVLFRLVGRDALQRSVPTRAETYWQPRAQTVEASAYRHPF
jgi:hypothetical protein